MLQQNGNGWSWGRDGYVHIGADAKKQAVKQGLIQDGKEKVNECMAKCNYFSHMQLGIAIAEWRAHFNVPEDGLAFAYVTQEERNKVASDDFGWPEERKYPVTDQEHLDAAVKLIGRAPKEEQGRIRANLKRIAARRGLKLPDSWVNE